MAQPNRSWQDELGVIDGVMKAISGITDPDQLVKVYWDGVGDFIPESDHVSLSRRGEQPPYFLVTRSSRFTEHPNPWKERHRLPRLTGGLLGEMAYANRPVIIEDLPARLRPDDPGWFYLQGYKSAVALPQYDGGEGLNIMVMLLSAGQEFDPARLPMIHWQAGLFGRGTQNLVLRNQLADALAALDRELRTVGDIQRSLLPQDLPRIDGLELAAYYQTSANAGGDYYDFVPLDDGRWGMFIADVSGHGTPAAVLMAITHSILHAQQDVQHSPPMLLKYLNERLTQSYTRSGTFVTAFYGVLDPESRRLEYAAAGHNPPRLRRAGSVLALDERGGRGGGLPLGMFPEQEYKPASVDLARGDMLLLYTDGITEAMAPRSGPAARPMFGVDRLDRQLIASGGGSAAACIERVRESVNAFTNGAPAADDQTLIAMKWE